MPSLAQYVNHTHRKEEKKESRKVGKDGKTRWKRRINIQDDRDGTAAPSPAKGKEAGRCGGVAGYNRRQKEKQP